MWGLEVTGSKVWGGIRMVRLQGRGQRSAGTCVLACCCCCWLIRVCRASTESGETHRSEDSCFWRPSIHTDS